MGLMHVSTPKSQGRAVSCSSLIVEYGAACMSRACGPLTAWPHAHPCWWVLMVVRCGVVARAVHVWAKHEARKASGPLQGEAASAVRAPGRRWACHALGRATSISTFLASVPL